MKTQKQRITGSSDKKTPPGRWQRSVLLAVLAYEAAGCLPGGIMLVLAPDGSLMKMPVDIMRGAFADFLLPGFLLTGLGLLNAVAFAAELGNIGKAWQLSALAIGGLFIWFVTELMILQQAHWLHAMWGLPVVLAAVMLVLQYRGRYKARY